MKPIRNSRADITKEGGGARAQLPPIGRRSSKAHRDDNQAPAPPSKNSNQQEDKYEQMRNRSRNNADRLQQLKDIKSQYTKKKGEEQLPAKRQSNARQSSKGRDNNPSDSHQQQSQQQQQYDFQIFEIEKVNKNNSNDDEHISALMNRNHNGGKHAESEIEALERELQQLRSDISNQQESIDHLDGLKKKYDGNEGSSSTPKGGAPPPIDKNQAFGQRVKGKEISDYWNGQEQKTAYRVQQVPGGQSQISIGGDYNFFKDKENSAYIQGGQKEAANNNNQREPSPNSNTKKHPNQQTYNIINHGGEAATGGKQHIPAGVSISGRGGVGASRSSAQSINVFDGHSQQQQQQQQPQQQYQQQLQQQQQQQHQQQQQKQSNNKESQFVNSLYYQQEKDRQNNQGNPYNRQATDITFDGRKNVRVLQPPGGISQITFG